MGGGDIPPIPFIYTHVGAWTVWAYGYLLSKSIDEPLLLIRLCIRDLRISSSALPLHCLILQIDVMQSLGQSNPDLLLIGQVGHSGQIGNAPNLAGKKSKSMLQMFSMHIWYSFEFLTMKKAKGKLKMDYGMLSSPYFVTPVSRNDEGFLEIIPSSRLWFQVSWHYLKS